MISGSWNALGGVLLAGRLDQSYPGMGNEHLPTSRQIIYGLVIVGMLLLHGRSARAGT